MPARPPHRRAFTLIELILVMLILVIILAVAAPRMSGFVRGRSLEQATAQLVSLGGWARSHAMSEGAVYRLDLDVPHQAYRLSVQNGAAWDVLGHDQGGPFSLPEGVRMSCDAPADGNVQGIPFYPSGRTMPATIRLSDDGGNVATIASPSATEILQVLPEGGQH